MSNVPGYRRGVPVWQLVALILVILGAGVISYIFYDERVRLERELKSVQDELADTLAGLNTRTEEVDGILQSLGVTGKEQIDMLLKDCGYPTANLEEVVKSFLADRQTLIGELGIVLTEEAQDADGNMKPKFLESYIAPARQAGELPATQKGKVAEFIQELIRFDKAMTARDKHVSDGQEAVKALDQQIDDKRKETYKTLTEWREKEASAWAEREQSRDLLRFEPLKWDAEKEVISAELALEQAINNKLVMLQKKQVDMATPVDGTIVAYDWRTRRGTIDLGARDRVKTGYEFDVYALRPGPDRPDKRLHHGRARLIAVYPETSLFVVTEMNPDNPVIRGDHVSSQLYDETRHKTFVIKGWFPPNGEFTAEAIAALIRRDGGVVQDELTLDTDYLILGQTGNAALTDPGADVPAEPPAEQLAGLSPEAQEKVKEAFQAFQQARHFYVTVLSLDKFKRYMDRQGTQALR
jgi:hypothetical protein